MGPTDWTDGFCVGHPEIDLQHRSFLEDLKECCECAAPEREGEFPAGILARLKEHAASHFLFEEGLLRSAGYPDLERHLAQHRRFEALLSGAEAALAAGRVPALRETVGRLRDWALQHILEEDRKYLPFLAQSA